ncbi:MAG: thioredoxin family protein [Anaerolineae bacterium]|nr:thioredoxin family protein [Anaerolineae bacterium]
MQNLKSAMIQEGLIADIDLVKVHDDVEATRFKFLGSPSFLVNGSDLWQETRETFALSCRIYATPNGIKGFPTVNMLREKLHSLVEQPS